MADFDAPGWGLFITVATIVSIIACAALAWSLASRRAPTTPAGDTESTGHVWDEDLRELNNPLPRWWLYLFYITCAFAAAYLALYPGLGSWGGTLGWSTAARYEAEIAAADAAHAPLFAGYLERDVAAVATDPEAVAMGERLYLTYCTGCHGSDARGGRSFPNLADADWLGAGDPDYVARTIREGRSAVMPAMAAALGAGNVENVAHHVLSLSDSDHDADKAALGAPLFAVCAGCHGAEGRGNPAVGAPDLTDDTWLYGGSLASVTHAIENGLVNEMPPFGGWLSEGKTHLLAAYVWSLSHGTVDDGTEPRADAR